MFYPSTEQWHIRMYTKPGEKFAQQELVDHSRGEYERGNVHSNTVEGFFPQLRRSIDGARRDISERHPDR